MNKLAGAVLLVALGLGIGLWLGFDPQARATVQENANKASQSFAQVGAEVNTEVTSITSQTTSSGSSRQQEPAGTSSGKVNLNVNLQNLWDGARLLWVSFISKFRLRS
ncbi:MAG TPA: hypothetical protein VFH29_05420 [Anaerolineales bacterium]|nr:hypothetical protein [Anaerolineales bacterium]